MFGPVGKSTLVGRSKSQIRDGGDVGKRNSTNEQFDFCDDDSLKEATNVDKKRYNKSVIEGGKTSMIGKKSPHTSTAHKSNHSGKRSDQGVAIGHTDQEISMLLRKCMELTLTDAMKQGYSDA